MYLAVLLAVSAPLACGGSLPNDTTPRGSMAGATQPRSARTSAVKQGTYQDENSVGMSDERVRKWRWEGDRKECYFVTGNKCFTSSKKACRAAKCGQRGCEIEDEGAPARVMCKGDDDTAKALAERDAIKARNQKAEGKFDDSKFRDTKPKRKFVPKLDSTPAADAAEPKAADKRKKRKKRKKRRKKRAD